MDDLLNEINRKRRSLEASSITANKKYFKRGDMIAKEVEERKKYMEDLNKKKTDLLQKETDGAEKSQKSVNELIDYFKHEKEDISKETVIDRLRSKNVPIRIFGETDHDAWQRLKLIEMMDKEENKGLLNEFQAALQRLENSFFPGVDDLASSTENSEKKFSILDTELTLDEIRNMQIIKQEFDIDQAISVITNFIKNMLNIWAEDLNSRKISKNQILGFKIEAARFEQTSEYLNPLLNRIKNNLLTVELMKSMTLIVYHCLKKDYIKANDIYLQMAIGNAPWPIGVTMVGIHARTGRERISTRHVAHALNDETQRKYIQALKRLMTLCQKTYPTDPSKSVDF